MEFEGQRYSFMMRFVHWLRALIVLGVFSFGLLMANDWGAGWVGINHKQFGLLVFVLSVVQIMLRLIQGVPDIPALLQWWEKKLFIVVHFLLYIFLVVTPLMGFLTVMAYGRSVQFFIVSIPSFIDKDVHLGSLFSCMHAVCAYSLIVCVGLHVLGALKHRYYDKREGVDVMSRML